MTTHTDPLAEQYIRLAHGLDAHIPGYIDGYGGPAEWADRSPRTPAGLQGEWTRLEALVEAEPDAERQRFLRAQLRAMRTSLRLLSGERLEYRDEVRGLYDIEARREPEATFEAAIQALDAALPGSGSVLEREQRLRERVTVPVGDLLRVIEPVLDELRARTQRRYPLPAGEGFSTALVSDRPWGGYNWPLGNFQSRIDINTDLPVLLPALPDLLAHEGYPGHHTEHALKEQHLARGRGWAEHSVQLINAPECVVSEGIAMSALGALMDRDELRGWLTGELSAHARLDPEAVGAYLDASAAREGLSCLSGNAALLLHAEQRPEAEVLEYLRTYGLKTEEQAAKALEFISAPLSRSYLYTYTEGERLVGRVWERGGAAAFRELLTRPLTPGALAEWTEQE